MNKDELKLMFEYVDCAIKVVIEIEKGNGNYIVCEIKALKEAKQNCIDSISLLTPEESLDE